LCRASSAPIPRPARLFAVDRDPGGVPVSGLVGIAIERGIIQWLYGRPLEPLLATWGLSLILQQATRTIFGANNKLVSAPTWMSGSFDLGGLTLTWSRLWIVIFAIVVFVILQLVLNRTALGLQMQAVTQNRRMASAMGIRTPFVDAMTFGLGSGIAGMAGVALSQIDNVSPNLGRATSSTASWSWCSAASAISGAR
jgi:urea transport system permease protein